MKRRIFLRGRRTSGVDVMLTLWCLITLALAPALHSSSADPDNATLSAIVRARQFEITVSPDGALGGPGVEFLIEEGGAAQFFAIAEEHGLAIVPKTMAAIWPGLKQRGYRHLALEVGSWTARFLDQFVKTGDRAALINYANAAGINLFSGEEDYHFIEIMAAGEQPAAPAVWGLDQEIRPLPLLRRLAQLAATDAERAEVQRFIDSVRPPDLSGVDYLAHTALITGYSEEIKRLAAAFEQDGAWPPDPEARMILDLLDYSNRLYDRQVTANKPWRSIREREQGIKRWFRHYYELAAQSGSAPPKVLIRMGSAHIARENERAGEPNLGSLLTDLTGGDRSRLFVLRVTCGNCGSRYGSGEAIGEIIPCTSTLHIGQQRLLVDHARFAVTLFDLRAMGRDIRANRIKLTPGVAHAFEAYDALLVVKSGSPLRYGYQIEN